MKKSSLLLSALIAFNVSISAQQLYMPRNIHKAVEKGTRTVNGQPGNNYWQNSGDYKIDFTLDTDSKTVSGSEEINYHNNSPDTLKTAVIRFVTNLHKATSPRSNKVSKDFITEGLKIKTLEINGENYTVNSEDWETFADIKLNKPMLPNSVNKFRIVWEYALSKESEREGQIDDHSVFCAYAYPRISVYDDYNGWDRLPHLGRGEFYNDFNNYNISISAPKNWIVYATGMFQNPDEVLQPEFAKRFKTSLNSPEIIHVATKDEVSAGKVTKPQQNIWKFKAENVPDFTFGASNSYVWDAGSVQLNSKRVSVQAAYNAGTPDFEKYVEWEKYCIKWFSENWPGVEYPYPTMTAFQGFADMEYPMMVNDTSIPDNLQDSRQTVDHEIAHTYFPFYMGINETRYAFMDEGWATALEYLIGEAENGKKFNDEMFTNFRVKRYILDPSAEEDQPVISMSHQVSGSGYGNNSYIKPAFAYLALKDYLGDAKFKKALHYYMEQWHGKHPTPWDFFGSMNAGSGQDLNWFWNNWFFSNNYIDLKLKSVKRSGQNFNVEVENTGGFAIPFDLITEFTDGTTDKKHFTPKVWEKNQKSTLIEVKSNEKIKNIRLDSGVFMDYTPKNNNFDLK